MEKGRGPRQQAQCLETLSPTGLMGVLTPSAALGISEDEVNEHL